jgi:hypothetical protein
MTRPKANPLRDSDPEDSAATRQRREVLENIRRFDALSRRGIWGLALFTFLSFGAVQGLSLLPVLPEKMRQLLGPAPPVHLISIALVVYSFSALILILGRMMSGSGSYRGWPHLGYLSGFYIFYYLAGALHDNFWAVFAAGLTILGLEYYHVRTTCTEAILREKETLDKLERLDKFY